MSPQYDVISCSQCNCTEALLWKSIGEKQQLCNDCFEQIKNHTKQETEINRRADDRRIKLRKSTRSTRYGTGSSNSQGGISSKNIATKSSGRGRRSICRRPPMKAPAISATTQYVKSLFYKGSYIQIGDIVSLCNSKSDIFYAQIRGLMIDNFCEKSAFITWLLPTQSSPAPTEFFDPSTYIIGPEEDQPRLLSCMEFVMHAPSDYFHDKNTPFPSVESHPYGLSQNPRGGFIWTNIDSVRVQD